MCKCFNTDSLCVSLVHRLEQTRQAYNQLENVSKTEKGLYFNCSLIGLSFQLNLFSPIEYVYSWNICFLPFPITPFQILNVLYTYFFDYLKTNILFLRLHCLFNVQSLHYI